MGMHIGIFLCVPPFHETAGVGAERCMGKAAPTEPYHRRK